MATRTAHSEIDLDVNFTIEARFSNDDSDKLKTNLGKKVVFLEDVLNTGVDAKQANRAYVFEDLVISPGSPQTFLLSGVVTRDVGYGSGFDSLGQLMDFEEMVCLIVKQTAGPGRCEFVKQSYTVDWINSDAATVANGGALKPGSVRMWYQDDTDALDMSTSPINAGIELSANGGDVTVSVYALGRHDDNESSSSSRSSSSSSSASTSSTSSASSASTSTY